MEFREHLIRIGREFPGARGEAFKGHPLAQSIRSDWPQSLRGMIGDAWSESFEIASSAGKGQWSEAPWIAVFHASVTESAMAGFYPVYLFEPGFKTVCLVLGQGAQALRESVGQKAALSELARRAAQLRANSSTWKARGFSAGPFRTLKSVSARLPSDAGEGASDAWSVAVAFGRRYVLDDLPTEEALAADLRSLLDIYKSMANDKRNHFASIDRKLGEMNQTGELPEGSVDGAVKIITHREIETRIRDRRLVSEVKKRLGCTCQACLVPMEATYGPTMSGYVEVHHKTPLSSLPATGAILKPTADDFMVLCSNCHKAIHRAGCPDLETFQKMLSKVSCKVSG